MDFIIKFANDYKSDDMNEYNKYIRFDWAAKRMLRDKANFGVIEGLITILINEELKKV